MLQQLPAVCEKKSSSENSKMYLKTSKGVGGMNVSRDDPIQSLTYFEEITMGHSRL